MLSLQIGTLLYHSSYKIDSLMLLILLVVALAAASYFYYLNWYRPKRILSWYKETLEVLGYNVVSLPFVPLKISLSQCQKHNEREFKDAFYDEKYKWHNYDVVLANTGNIPTLILLKPVLLQSFFSPTKQPLFYKSLTNKVAFNLTLKDSLIFNSDQKWKRKRKIFTDILNFQFIKAKIPKIVQICQNTLNSIESQNQSQQTGSNLYQASLAQHFKDMIAEVVIKLFFGCEAKELTVEGRTLSSYLSAILAEARNQSSGWLVLLFGEKVYEWGIGGKYKNLYKRINTLRSVVRDLLLRKMKEMPQQMNGYNDLFESLFFLKQKSKAEDDIIQMEEFISEFCAFLTASNDTTGNYINMVMFYLSQNDAVRHKLQKSIREKFSKSSEINYYQLRDINLLDWCLFQTTRMYGPATSIMLRQSNSDTYIENIPLLKGTGIKIQMLASHYNPKIYKDPFTFHPTRWSITDPQNHPYSFGGFGSGSHSCIGKQLALLSTKLVISVMLLRYEDIQIKQANKIQMVCRGLYQPTAFTTILTKVQRKEQNRDIEINYKRQEIDRTMHQE